MKYCPYCNTVADDSNTYCRVCGKPLNGDSNAQSFSPNDWNSLYKKIMILRSVTMKGNLRLSSLLRNLSRQSPRNRSQFIHLHHHGVLSLSPTIHLTIHLTTHLLSLFTLLRLVRNLLQKRTRPGFGSLFQSSCCQRLAEVYIILVFIMLPNRKKKSFQPRSIGLQVYIELHVV